jgi:nucleotide-binding universal stress UspA family protein
VAATSYSSIVVGTDGSDTAGLALERAGELAALAGATLHVVSGYRPAVAHVGGRQGTPEQADWSISTDYKVDAVLDGAAARLRDSGVEIEVHGRKGDPVDAILEVARECSADLIVLGSKGMHGPRRVLGSVPNSVSHQAECDVLIVKTD